MAEYLREPDERTKYKLTDAPEDRKDKVDYGTQMTLSEEQRDELKKYLKDQLDDIKASRDEFGLETTWQENEDQYYGNLPDKTFPFEDSSNFNVPITREKVDVVVNDIMTAVHTPEYIWEVLPTEGNSKNISEIIKSCEAKKKFLTFECRHELMYEEEDAPVVFDSVLHGTGWMELPWHYETDSLRDCEKYEGTEEGLNKFLKNYPTADKAENPDDWKRYHQMLIDGKDIELISEYDTPIWDNPKPKHIPIRDLFIHAKCRDIKESHCHGKRYSLTGSQLERKEEEEVFNEEPIDDLKYITNESGDLIARNDFLTTEFTCYTFEVRYAFDVDEPSKRYLVDMMIDEDEGVKDLLLRIRRFPYWHNRPYFIPKYVTEKKEDSVYREGLAEILSDTQDLGNVALNFYLDCMLFSSIPIAKADLSKKKELGAQLRKGVYPGMTLWLQNSNDVQFDTTKASGSLSGLPTLQYMAENYAQKLTGIGASLSGQENPVDPKAPAEKTRMLLAQASKRLAGMIRIMQRSNKEVAFQLIELYYQHRPNGKVYRAMGEEGEYAFPSITREELRQRTEYSPVGSIETVDRMQLLQQAMTMYEITAKDPILSIPENRKYVLENIFRFMGGVWERSISKMIMTEEELMEREAKLRAQAMIIKEKMQQAEQRKSNMTMRAKQLAQSGMPKEQIAEALQNEFPPIPGQGQLEQGEPNAIPGQAQTT